MLLHFLRSTILYLIITMQHDTDKVRYYEFCVNESKFYLITRLNCSCTLNLHSLLLQNSVMFKGTLLLGRRKC